MRKVGMCFIIRFIICMLIIFPILFLTSCKNKVDINSIIDTKEILSYISYQQSEDGGFSDSISLSIIDYNDYYDTYSSFYILDLLNYELSAEQYSRGIAFLKKIDINALIDIEDNLDLIFFYLRIADILDYKSSEKQLSKINNYIRSLQTQDGYFVNSTANKELLIKGELQIEMLGAVNLYSISNIIELSKINELDIDYINLGRYLNLFLTEKNVAFNNQFENLQIAAGALLIKAQDVWNIPINDDSILKIKQLYTKKIKEIPTNEFDIGLLHNLIIIGNYLDMNDNSIISKALLSYLNVNGFSPFPGIQNHTTATRIALLAFNELSTTLEHDTKDKIINNIVSNQFYDGRFVVGRKDISYQTRIEDTYYALLLIEELGTLDSYLPDLRRFYYSRLEGIKLDEYSIYDMFYLLSIAVHSNISVKEEDVANFIQFFSNYITENKTIDYQFAILVVEDLRMWDITYSNEIKEKFLASVNTEDNVNNYISKFMELYYKYTVLKTMNQEYTSAYSEIIDYFNKNFSKLENRIYPSKYVAQIIQNEKLAPNIVKKREEIFKEIYKCRDGILFSYTNNFRGTFDSTSGIIKTIRSLGHIVTKD